MFLQYPRLANYVKQLKPSGQRGYVMLSVIPPQLYSGIYCSREFMLNIVKVATLKVHACRNAFSQTNL